MSGGQIHKHHTNTMEIKTPDKLTAALTLDDLMAAVLGHVKEESGIDFEDLTGIRFFDSMGNPIEVEIVEIDLTGGAIDC